LTHDGCAAGCAGGGPTRKDTNMAELPVPEPAVERLLDEIEGEAPLVGILMGSESDREIMTAAADELSERGIRFEMKVLSAHRNPDGVRDYSLTAESRGLKVIIAGAGKAAALPGVVASFTELPVIGVPIRTSDLGGLDSLLSIVQMPSGVPVACVAINGARNAAILAAQILRICWASRGGVTTLTEEESAGLDERSGGPGDPGSEPDEPGPSNGPSRPRNGSGGPGAPGGAGGSAGGDPGGPAGSAPGGQLQ
jgi:5-(carboxyamino)imidazole ribonucleotide mutase